MNRTIVASACKTAPQWRIRSYYDFATHRMMDICLSEIERCQQTGIKPNFIVLIGSRYGRPPLPAHIRAHEFEAVLSRIGGDPDRILAESWYQRDDNAVPAEYLLKPRSGEFVDTERWKAIKQPPGEVLVQTGAARLCEPH